MPNELDKRQEDTTFVAGATKREKNTEHTRMYIFFLDFFSHYSQQKSAVRSTANKITPTIINKVASIVLLYDS